MSSVVHLRVIRRFDLESQDAPPAEAGTSKTYQARVRVLWVAVGLWSPYGVDSAAAAVIPFLDKGWGGVIRALPGCRRVGH